MKIKTPSISPHLIKEKNWRKLTNYFVRSFFLWESLDIINALYINQRAQKWYSFIIWEENSFQMVKIKEWNNFD